MTRGSVPVGAATAVGLVDSGFSSSDLGCVARTTSVSPAISPAREGRRPPNDPAHLQLHEIAAVFGRRIEPRGSQWNACLRRCPRGRSAAKRRSLEAPCGWPGFENQRKIALPEEFRHFANPLVACGNEAVSGRVRTVFGNYRETPGREWVVEPGAISNAPHSATSVEGAPRGPEVRRKGTPLQ